MSKIVTFIGGGDLGQALAGLLRKRENVRIWDINPDRSSRHDLTLSQAVSGAEFIFITTPAVAVPTVVSEIVPKLDPTQKIIFLSKGLTSGGQNIWEFSSEVLGSSLKAVVSGPMLSREIKDGKGGAGLVAGDEKATESVVALFENTGLELLDIKTDPAALAWVGVFKNIYAVGLGYARARGAGDNQIGFLVTLCLDEMKSWLDFLCHSDEDLAFSIAGLGDLVATGFSDSSKNGTAGRLLAQNHKHLEVVPEGLHSLDRLARRFNDLSQFPLTDALRQIYQGQEIKDNPWSN